MERFKLKRIPDNATLEDIIKISNENSEKIENKINSVEYLLLQKIGGIQNELQNLNIKFGNFENGMTRLLADLDEIKQSQKQLLNDSDRS